MEAHQSDPTCRIYRKGVEPLYSSKLESTFRTTFSVLSMSTTVAPDEKNSAGVHGNLKASVSHRIFWRCDLYQHMLHITIICRV